MIGVDARWISLKISATNQLRRRKNYVINSLLKKHVVSRNNVRPVNKLSPAKQAELVRKLNQRRIRWICREMEKGAISVCRIARLQHITPRHARRVYKKYKGIKKPVLLPCGRKPKPITQEEVDLIMALRKEHPVGAVSLEKLLDSRGRHIPHNHIHRVLRAHGLARPEPKKQKRRRWVRYERMRSNSLWHCDWFEEKGEHLILFEDDDSRLLTGFCTFSNATAVMPSQRLNKQ